MTPYAQTLIDQFDGALGDAPAARKVAILREFTELFLRGVTSHSERQLAIFNSVMGRLVKDIDRAALQEISRQLASVECAPANVIVHLSSSDDIRVAGPVLEKSVVLTDEDLVAVARIKSQDHLAAIAGRAQLNEPVTQVLVERGESGVVQKVLANEGARLSELSFVKLVDGARRDKTLAKVVSARADLPAELKPFVDMALG
jgi:uncharacterized protein (DUF2336 family)